MGVAERRLPTLHCHGPSDGVLDCKGPLSGMIAPNTLAEVNEEVKLAADGQKESEVLISPSHLWRRREWSSTAVSMEFEHLCDNFAEI